MSLMGVLRLCDSEGNDIRGDEGDEDDDEAGCDCTERSHNGQTKSRRVI